MWWPVAEAAEPLPIPAHLTIDADLREWPSQPTFSAPRVWVAAGPGGVAVAGEVLDPRLAMSNAVLEADIWLSLPPADLPPVGFGNQFGETLVPSPAACDDLDDAEGCRAWWTAQQIHRDRLSQAFTQRYHVQYAGISGPRPDRGATGTTRVASTGWTFEAWIPLGDLPATTSWPITSLRVAVEIVGKNPSTVLYSTGAKHGDPTTFTALGLVPPIPLPGDPILENLVANARVRSHLFRRPGERGLYHWGNLAQGYQYTPSLPSPTETHLDTTGRRAFRWRQLEVVFAPLFLPAIAGSGGTTGLAVLRDGRMFGRYAADRVDSRVDTADRLLLSVSRRATVSPLGAGACGACPTLDLAVLALFPDGSLTPAWEWSGSADGAEPEVAVTIAADGASIHVFGWRDAAHTDGIDEILWWEPLSRTFRPRAEAPASP